MLTKIGKGKHVKYYIYDITGRREITNISFNYKYKLKEGGIYMSTRGFVGFRKNGKLKVGIIIFDSYYEGLGNKVLEK